MTSLQKKVALITGGSKGSGYGIAASLMQQGVRVAITSRSQEGADRAAKELNSFGVGEVMGFAADVRNGKAQKAIADQIEEKWGGIDVLVANAGLGYFGSIETLTEEDWHETIDTNLTGVFHSVKACLARCAARDTRCC